MKNFTFKTFAVACGMLMCSAGADAQMVISKVFYAGTVKKGATTNYTGGEEYIELHNNSSKDVNIAGMYIGLIESEGTTGAYLAADEPKNEIKLKQVYQIPTDKEYNVAPWGNVVIAACAKDHSADAEGNIDLSKADFSFGSMTGDSEDVTKLNLVFSFNANTKAVNLTNGGDAGVVIISKNYGDKYLTAGDESTWVYANGKTTGSRYLPFNAYYAMDAVEILKTKLVDGVYTIDAARKRLKDSFDKGYVVTDQKMIRDGYVAYRKTALNNEGSMYLYDTNNSCTDFAVSNTVGIGEYDKEEFGVTEVKVTIPESGYLPFYAEKAFFTDKGLYVGYVTISSGVLKCNDMQGSTYVFNNSPYLLIGAPGEHTVKYTEATRLLATAGQDNWISDGDDKYVNGVLTVTTKNRYPMKFVADTNGARFVRDMVDGNPQTMKIDVATEGRFYINLNYLNEEETVVEWTGTKPSDIITAVKGIAETAPKASNACYNLAGQRVGANAKGIIIMNGKKFMK